MPKGDPSSIDLPEDWNFFDIPRKNSWIWHWLFLMDDVGEDTWYLVDVDGEVYGRKNDSYVNRCTPLSCGVYALPTVSQKAKDFIELTSAITEDDISDEMGTHAGSDGRDTVAPEIDYDDDDQMGSGLPHDDVTQNEDPLSDHQENNKSVLIRKKKRGSEPRPNYYGLVKRSKRDIAVTWKGGKHNHQNHGNTMADGALLRVQSATQSHDENSADEFLEGTEPTALELQRDLSGIPLHSASNGTDPLDSHHSIQQDTTLGSDGIALDNEGAIEDVSELAGDYALAATDHGEDTLLSILHPRRDDTTSTTDGNIDLHQKVRDWEQIVKPALMMEKMKESFDINEYEDRLLDCFDVPPLDSSSSLEDWTVPSNDNRPVLSFNSVCRGKRAWEISRYFLVALQMANECCVEIQATEKTKTGDNIQLTLLSFERYSSRRNSQGSRNSRLSSGEENVENVHAAEIRQRKIPASILDERDPGRWEHAEDHQDSTMDTEASARRKPDISEHRIAAAIQRISSFAFSDDDTDNENAVDDIMDHRRRPQIGEDRGFDESKGKKDILVSATPRTLKPLRERNTIQFNTDNIEHTSDSNSFQERVPDPDMLEVSVRYESHRVGTDSLKVIDTGTSTYRKYDTTEHRVLAAIPPISNFSCSDDDDTENDNAFDVVTDHQRQRIADDCGSCDDSEGRSKDLLVSETSRTLKPLRERNTIHFNTDNTKHASDSNSFQRRVSDPDTLEIPVRQRSSSPSRSHISFAGLECSPVSVSPSFRDMGRQFSDRLDEGSSENFLSGNREPITSITRSPRDLYTSFYGKKKKSQECNKLGTKSPRDSRGEGKSIAKYCGYKRPRDYSSSDEDENSSTLRDSAMFSGRFRYLQNLISCEDRQLTPRPKTFLTLATGRESITNPRT